MSLKYVNRTPCHTACTDADTLSAQHIALIYYTLTRGSSCAFLKIVIPSLVSRHVSRPAPSIVSSISLSSTSPSFTGSRSRVITSRIHCADSRGFGGDGFTNPEPRTGYEPKRTFDNPIVTEQEIEHSTEESQIPEIDDKSKEVIHDPFSLPYNQSIVVFDSRFFLEALRRLKKQTWTTNKFRALQASPRYYLSEEQVRNDHEFVSLKEKV